MLPATSGDGAPLTSITRGAANVPFTTQTIKGTCTRCSRDRRQLSGRSRCRDTAAGHHRDRFHTELHDGPRELDDERADT